MVPVAALLATAALDQRLRVAVAEEPFLCNYPVAITLTSRPYGELHDYVAAHPEARQTILDSLAYFDPLHLAPSIQCPTLVSVGMCDDVCPAATILPVFERITAPKALHVYPDLTHTPCTDFNAHAEGVDADLSGFLFRDAKTKKAIIGVNATHHRNRQRFTIAHELGHYLLHAGEPVHVDKANVAYRINRRDEQSASGQDDSEREANLFAAELLMPARFLEKDVAAKGIDLLDDTAVNELANKYGVSAQALTFRLMNIGLIANSG